MDSSTLLRYIEGKSDQKEKELIAEWLDSDEKNMDDFLILRNIYDASIWIETTESNPELRIEKKRIKLIYEFLKIAAVFLIAWGCCYYFLSTSKDYDRNAPVYMQTVSVPEGQRAEIFLSDGTKVWLNAKTTLSFPDQFTGTERKVKLNGEAYFDVVHDQSKKFIVETEEYHIQVLGTEFNVKSYFSDGRFETDLIRGMVEVSSNFSDDKVVLAAHSKAYAENGKLICADLNDYNQFLWREGLIAFENECIKEIFKKLQLYYDVQIEVKNEKIMNDRYTGKFRTKDGVEHVLKVLQLRYQFKYVKGVESNKVIIY